MRFEQRRASNAGFCRQCGDSALGSMSSDRLEIVVAHDIGNSGRAAVTVCDGGSSGSGFTVCISGLITPPGSDDEPYAGLGPGGLYSVVPYEGWRHRHRRPPAEDPPEGFRLGERRNPDLTG